MNKVKRQIKKYYEHNYSHDSSINLIKDKANLKNNKFERMYLFMRTKKFFILSTCLFIAVVAAIIIGCTNKNNTPTEQPIVTDTVIQLDLNPSISLTIDENGNISMQTIVHEIDRYNFNKGMNDIASGASDNENGRFEELGWAKSFTTTGEAEFDVTWEQGSIVDTTSQNVVDTNGRDRINERDRNRNRVEQR